MGETHCEPKSYRERIKTYQDVVPRESDGTAATDHQKIRPPTYKEAEGCACNTRGPHRRQHNAHSGSKRRRSAGILCGVGFPDRATIVGLRPRPIGPC